MNRPTHANVLQTKIKPPLPRANWINRTRLLRPDIAEQAGSRLIAVIAPAGFGKTTLLNQWVRGQGGLCGWVSLDTTDNDLMRFWRYVAYAFQPSLPSQAADRVISLIDSFPNVSAYTAVDALLNELVAVREPVVLVLDDYHVIGSQAVHESVSYAIDYLPDNVRIAIASRSELPFAASKWSARGQRTDVTALELLFDVEEVELFYREVVKLPLSPAHVGKLMAYTEGWVAGLQLVSISLSLHRNRMDSFIGQFAGHHPDISDYLLQEVFRGLDAGLQQFLLHSSVLQRLDAELCDAVLVRTDSRRMLETLKGLNLFLIPLDDFGTCYRYHHLFSEFLQKECRQSDPALWQRLHRSASRCLAERELADEAIGHAIAAEDFAYASSLLEGHIVIALRRGEFSTLLGWFGAFPARFELSPLLSLLHAFTLVVTRHFAEAERILEQVERKIEGLSEEIRGEARSGAFFVRTNLAFTSGKLAEWYVYAEELDGMFPESAVFYDFNYNRSEPLVRRTEFGLKGNLFPEVEAIAIRYTGMLQSRGWGDALVNQYVLQSLAEGYYEWNRLDECKRVLEQTGKVGRSRQVPGLFVPSRVTYARICMAQGRLPLAREALEEAAETVRSWGAYTWASPLLALLAWIDELDGHGDRAMEELCRLGLAAGDKPTFNRLFEYVILTRLLAARGQEMEALRLLELLKQQGARERCLSSVAEITVLQSMIEERTGNRRAALLALEEALDIGRQGGWIRLILDEGEPMRLLLAQYKRSGQDRLRSGVEVREGFSNYIERLLTLFRDAEDESPIRGSRQPALIEPLTPAERNLVDKLRQGASNKQIAGDLNLTEGTVKVYLSRIYGKLGVSSRTQALLRIQELRLFDP